LALIGPPFTHRRFPSGLRFYATGGFGNVSLVETEYGRGAPGEITETVLKPRGATVLDEGASVRVLVIEDDRELAETVAVGLRQARMAVDVALDGETGLARALVNDYDVIVLDRDLPGLHGDQVCARLVDGGGRSRLLMLTAAATNDDLVDGLGLGADDYLPKPFDFPVLVARIGALARRAQPTIPPVLRSHDLVLDTAKRYARRDGRQLDLTPKEFGVLEQLLAARGGVVSAEDLLARVWDEAADPFTAAVKITISRLRAKLGQPPVIQTVAKAGYRI
jgi:DNA-binding response OmpR family regulator